MSSDRYSYFREFKSDKPTKRVRFSKEITNVYDCETEEVQNSGSFPLKNERSSPSDEIKCFDQDEFPTNESMVTAYDMHFGNATARNTAESDQCMYECDDKIDELTECNKQMTDKANSYPQLIESCSSKVSQSADYFNNNNSDMADLNLLIRETQQMAISAPARVQEANPFFISETLKMDPSCISMSEKNILQAAAEPIEQYSSLETRKRSLGGMPIEKQTSKINSYLRIDDDEIDSAVHLKDAVFNAWNKVKTQSAKVVQLTDVQEAKEKPFTLPKPSGVKFEYVKDLRPIKTVRKIGIKETEPTFPRNSDEIEESKMAYTAWKKKKDELLSQQVSDKRKREKKRRLDALMNERMRKRKAETAFLSWLSHKAAVAKIEKKKSQWLLERENEKLNEKIKRNGEANKLYIEWIRKKIFYDYKDHQIDGDKPPWIPPGKGNI